MIDFFASFVVATFRFIQSSPIEFENNSQPITVSVNMISGNLRRNVILNIMTIPDASNLDGT